MPLAAAALKDGSLVRLGGIALKSERGHYAVARQDDGRKTVLTPIERLRLCAKVTRG
jgi:hypothetical protein